MANVQFPQFKLVKVDTEESVTRSEVVRTSIDGELNGDKIPDRVELVQEGNRIGFRLKLGAYEKITQTGGEAPNPLFGTVAAKLSYQDKVIWEGTSPTQKENGKIQIERFSLGDYNDDGDLDIQFAVKKHTPDGAISGVFVLMNQQIADRELAQIENTVPPGEKPTPPDKPRQEDKFGFVFPTR